MMPDSTSVPPPVEARDRWGPPFMRTLLPALFGAIAILYFHPGAMEMDRIKWSLLLCTALLPVALFLRGALVQTALSPLSPALTAAAAVPAFMLLSCLRTGLPSLENFRLLIGLLVLLILAAVIRDGAWNRPRLAAAVLLAAGAVAAVYGVVQTAGIEPFYAENPNNEAVSTLGNTNAAAEVFAMLMPVACAGIFSRRRRYLLLCLPVLPALAAGLYATGSRGGLLATAAGIGVFAFLAHRSRPLGDAETETSFFARNYIRTVAAGALIVMAVLTAAGIETEPKTPFKNIETDTSVFSPEYPTNKVRLLVWKGTLAMIGDHPVLGAGPGRFPTEFPRYRDLEEARIRGMLGAVTEVENPHNEFLWAASEGGIGAAAALGLFLLLLVLQSASAAGRSREPERALQAAGLAGLFAAFAVLCLVRSPLHNPASACILFLAAGIIDATRYDAGTPRDSWTGRIFTATAGGAAILALAFYGGKALWSDALFASVGASSEFGSSEYERLQSAMAADDGNIGLVNFTGQMAAKIAQARREPGGRHAKDAERLLAEVLHRHPLHPGALRTLAGIRLRAGDVPAGMRMLSRSLQLTGSSENASEIAAQILTEEGRHVDAAEVLIETGAGAEDLMKHAEALFESGEFLAAAVYADALLDSDPLDVEALHLKARSLRGLGGGNTDAAFGLMQAAISLEWLEKGDYVAAAKSARRALKYAAAAGDPGAGSGGPAGAAGGSGSEAVAGAAAHLLAVAEAAQGRDFDPPGNPPRIPALAARLNQLSQDERLPPEVRSYLSDL